MIRYCTVFLILIMTFSKIGYAQDSVISEEVNLQSELTITVNPNNENELIVASMNGNSPIILFNSNDGGVTWQEVSLGQGVADPVLTYGDNNTAYFTYLDFGNTLEMYFATSTDNGENWNSQLLTLDGLAADRQWIKRDNSPSSPYYGTIYLCYFHPENEPDIHIVKIDPDGTIGMNHTVQVSGFEFVQNPAMDVTNDGTIVIGFLTRGEDNSYKIVSVKSNDGSETFSQEVAIADVFMYDGNGNPLVDVVGFAPGNSSRLQNSLQMAIDKSGGTYEGRAYITWTDFVEGNTEEGMNIYLSYSDDQGASWSSPIIVNDDNVSSSHQYFSAIDVNSEGVLCLSWYDRRIDPVNDSETDFYAISSIDGGQSFSPSMKLSSMSSDHNAITNGDTTFGVGEYNSIATSSTHIFTIWSDGRTNDGDLDVFFSKVDLNDVRNLDEHLLSPSIKLERPYPNPVIIGEQLIIKFNSSFATELEFSIKSINGTVVLRKEGGKYSAGTHEIPIDTRELSEGNYLVEIKHSKGTAIEKIVLLKD